MDTAILQQAELWAKKVTEKDLSSELKNMLDTQDEEALTDAFYRSLSFGTAGLRGVLGVGTNRMNVYTVRQASQGLADYLVAHYDNPSVVLARDSRNKGEDFVHAAASVLAANGVSCYVYPRIEPVPALSFATRYLHCSAGICITASHNPAQYNGYKVYNEAGCQIAEEAASAIQASIENTDIFDGVKSISFDEGLAQGTIKMVDDSVIDAFIDAVSLQSVPGCEPAEDFSVVYTPLNGSGIECVTKILNRVGITNVTVVPEQQNPDGDFPTCPYPNPEFREALECGLALCDKVHPDLLLANDPDADRVGVAVPHEGTYELLTGNEMGILLVDWLCRMKKAQGQDISSKVVVSTIVSSQMPDALAKAYGFQMRRVLTGFKYVGGQIDLLEEAGQSDRFLFGFEESYGYLAGRHVRDKDGIVASMLICEMASWYQRQGKDLYQAMQDLYAEYGYYQNGIVNVSFPGAAGAEKMQNIMRKLREQAPKQIAGIDVSCVVDYKDAVCMPCVNDSNNECASQKLPSSNVLEYQLADGNKIIIRPSGTEPKIKAYIFSVGKDASDAQRMQDKLAAAAKEELFV